MDISIRQGETLILNVTIDDLTADTVQLLVSNSNDEVVIDETDSFATEDGERVAQLLSNDTDLPLGDYTYMLKITYSDGTIEIMPEAYECEDDCELPTLTICEAIESPAVS